MTNSMCDIDFSDDLLRKLSDIEQKRRELTTFSYGQLNQKYRKRIAVSEALGKHGWTVNYRKTPNDAREWLNIIDASDESAIAEQFDENDIRQMQRDITEQYREKPASLYLDLAGRNYEAGRYTEAAMFYLATINYRINCITPAEIRRITRQCEKALTEIGASQYDDLHYLPVTRMFFICDALPSFKAFATRAFVDGKAHDLDAGVEPPYLNRNWLMHGRMTRLVEKYECIQLINALSTLIEIEKTCAQ